MPHSKSPDPKDVECNYCGKKGHKKSDCAQRKADLEKAKSKGRLAVPPQAVHAVHKVGYSSASTEDEVHSTSGSVRHLGDQVSAG